MIVILYCPQQEPESSTLTKVVKGACAMGPASQVLSVSSACVQRRGAKKNGMITSFRRRLQLKHARTIQIKPRGNLSSTEPVPLPSMKCHDRLTWLVLLRSMYFACD